MTTFTRKQLGASWRSWLAADLRRVGPEWLHLLWTLLFCMGVAAGFTVLGFALFARGDGAWRNLPGWLTWYRVNLVVSLCIGFTIHALFRLSERLIGAARIRRLGGPLRAVYFSAVPLVGVAIGWPLGSWLVNADGPGWFRLSDPNTVAGSLLISVLLSIGFYQFFAIKARQIDAERRAAEAQLRLLQGQIEPHFLFNTLANVAALMDTDVPRARQMLESFTDYLRSSLTALRHDAATLGSELDLVHNYLGLMKTRMEDRLHFSVGNDPALRDARLPPLLLQPLVENAIHHGLEPQVSGGTVRVNARAEAGMLVIEITDDGRGLQAPAARRRGAGVALANLRERLASQYGQQASLALDDNHPGTRATLRLPLEQAA